LGGTVQPIFRPLHRFSTRLRLLAALQFVNQPLAFVEVSGAALQ